MVRRGPVADLLARHLNTIDWGYFQDLASPDTGCPQRLERYGEFLHTLLPYVAAEPHAPFAVQQRAGPPGRGGFLTEPEGGVGQPLTDSRSTVLRDTLG